MQCTGIGPHLAARGKSRGFSLVAVGTWGIFLSRSVDGLSQLMFVERSQDSCLVMRHTSKSTRALAQQYTCFSRSCGRPRVPSQFPRDIGIPINFQEESGIVTF